MTQERPGERGAVVPVGQMERSDVLGVTIAWLQHAAKNAAEFPRTCRSDWQGNSQSRCEWLTLLDNCWEYIEKVL